jgi:hypothetical protein
VVFPGVNLAQHSADAGFVSTQDHKQVLHNKSLFLKLIDKFDMGQPLLVRADFILTFQDIDSVAAQNSPGLIRRQIV